MRPVRRLFGGVWRWLGVLLGLGIVGALLWPGGEERPSYGDFSVRTSSGSLSLSDLRGRALALYFGYTACPDICPSTLGALGAAFRIDPALAERATALFVSVDPARDEPPRIGRYAAAFHPRFRGGVLSEDSLAPVLADWGVFARRVAAGSAMGDLIDHSTQLFVLRPDGTVFDQLPHGTPPADIAAALGAAISSPAE